MDSIGPEYAKEVAHRIVKLIEDDMTYVLGGGLCMSKEKDGYYYVSLGNEYKVQGSAC
jgi:hypothetical protein